MEAFDDLQKKPIYPIYVRLQKYLKTYGRTVQSEINYQDLLRFQSSFPLYDRKGKDTLWETVLYPQGEIDFLNKALSGIYAQLKTGGDISVMEHLYVDRVDYCTFGNSKPFRIRIVNNFNDNYDYFYIKKADASRIYGLELEHILSPNRISYFVNEETLVEEHIAGIPGDMFIKQHLSKKDVNAIRLAKEFVKFNERCFVRLLGDMRSYNYVIDITPDFEEVHYRIRAIDFDQQAYEGKKSFYLPQYFKENYPFVELCINLLSPESVYQYQVEERILIAKRINAAKFMLKELLDTMSGDNISTPEKINQLRNELCYHHQTESYRKCNDLGAIIKMSLKEMIRKNKIHFQRKK